MEFLLIAAGGLFALLFVLNLIVQTFRRRPKIGFLHTLLAFLTLLLPLAGLIAAAPTPDSPARTLVWATAAVLFVPALLALLVEVRRPERLKQSRGLLGLGVAALLILSTLSVPAIREAVFLSIPPSPTRPVVLSAPTADNPPESSESPAPALTSVPTATRTQPPTLTPIPTATRFRFATRTPLPTPTLPSPCLALANFNVNLRAEPDLEADLLATIPYNTTVTLFGRNADSSWWFGEYEGKAGWIKGEFLQLSESCARLPERD